MHGQAISAVLLDAFGTLVELEPPGPHLRAGLERLAGVQVSDEEAAAAFEAEIAYYREHHLEGHDGPSLEDLRDRCAKVLAEELGLTRAADFEAVRAAMLGALRFNAYPDAAPALTTIRRNGVRVVAVSNWDCSLPEVLGRAGLSSLLDGVVSSAEVGAEKPDPEPFSAALECARAAPAQALHVGDSLEQDVRGARAAGVHGVLLDRSGGAGAKAAGVPGITSLEELPALVL